MSIKIDQAFVNEILAGGLAIDIVHENGLYSTWNGSAYVSSQGVYVPSASREHIEIRSFPASTKPYSLSQTDENAGLFQAIIKYPADVGSVTIKTKAEALLNLFKVGTKITYSAQDVNIVSKSRDGGRVEGGFYQVVCRINYVAYVTR